MRLLSLSGTIPRNSCAREGVLASPSLLVGWCGLADMLGGILWVLWAAGQLQGFGGGDESGGASFSPYVFFNRLLPLVLLPVVVGFVGLHYAQGKSYGPPRSVGRVLHPLGPGHSERRMSDPANFCGGDVVAYKLSSPECLEMNLSESGRITRWRISPRLSGAAPRPRCRASRRASCGAP